MQSQQLLSASYRFPQLSPSHLFTHYPSHHRSLLPSRTASQPSHSNPIAFSIPPPSLCEIVTPNPYSPPTLYLEHLIHHPMEELLSFHPKPDEKLLKNHPKEFYTKKLSHCSKSGDVLQALSLYDESRKSGVLLDLNHYNKLLYLCTVQSGGHGASSASHLGLQREFEIFQQMLNDNIQPNEATSTNAARVAAAKEDPEMAFELLKQMKSVDIAPKLRSYGPALYGFCKRWDADTMNFADIEKQINTFAKKANAGTLSIDETAGGNLIP
ncbi:unnamed protein product [Vicia faba]|uniref:PROP1-like PPR domain-containing protein n=1 Tax=Vicia faba TaxID=3906 RepID=A0AAV0YKQ2_VICFA|nr:unnamed protein product [Vicia faba]